MHRGFRQAFASSSIFLAFLSCSPTEEKPAGNQPLVSDPGQSTNPSNSVVAGNTDGKCNVPPEAALEDVSKPTTVVGTGTAAGCTADAFVAAVAKGGTITFNCGPNPVKIKLSKTAKVFNDTGKKLTIDGGNKVTLDGDGKVRILYQNTCDQDQAFTSTHCDNQDSPELTVQNLTFENGNSSSDPDHKGGGAIFSSGGRLKILNSSFFSNRCDDTGPDVGGGAVRASQQSENKPVYVMNSTFGGSEALGNHCSNGGALSSIGVSFSVINSSFSYNRAVGKGANPARDGQPGGGSGGAIYNDGNLFSLSLCGSKMQNNSAVEGGGAIFFVSNDGTGTLVIKSSTLTGNPSAGFETDGFPGIFAKAKGDPMVSDSTLSK